MYRFKLKEIEVGDTKTKRGKKTTVSGVDDETGTITWDVEDVADFSSTYKELEKAKDFLSKLEKTGKSKDDPAIDKLAAQIKELFNTFRTHIRKNYPEEYKRVLRLKESVNEDIYDKFLDDPQNPKGRAKAIISKFIKQYGEDASGMAVDRFAKQNNLKPEEKYILQYITKNDISISSKPGGPDFSALSEAEKLPNGDIYLGQDDKGNHKIKAKGKVTLYNNEDMVEIYGKGWGHNLNEQVSLQSINEEIKDLDNAKHRLKKVHKYLEIEYNKTRRGEKYVQINYIPVTRPQSQNPEWVNVRYDTDEELEHIKNSLKIPVKEGTFHGPREIAIYDGPDGETYIEKRGTGYYGYNNSFDFEAEDKAELKHKLNSWGYRLVAGSIDESVNEGFYSTPSDMEDSGLNVIPRDQIHAQKLNQAIEDSGLHAEWNAREGYFFFPEEEDMYDELEIQIQNLMDENNIQASIEGVWEESVNETALADKIIAPFDKEIEGLKLSKEKYQELLDKVSKLVKGLKEDEIKFNDEEMAKLHKDGELKKGGHSFKYKLSQPIKDLKEEEVDEGEGIGYMTPKAFDKNKKSTGASDIYYYKLGYKPVPKKIKGAGTIVKQLWEFNEFQQKRINAFDEIGEKLNRISSLLSNSKNETAEFYNENPGSYELPIPTDYIFKLLDEIDKKLTKVQDK